MGRRRYKAPKEEIVWAEFVSRTNWDKVRLEGRPHILIPDNCVKPELRQFETEPRNAKACLKLYQPYRDRLSNWHIPATLRRREVTILAHLKHLLLLHGAGAKGVLLRLVPHKRREEAVCDECLIPSVIYASRSRDKEGFVRTAQEVGEKTGATLGPSDISALGGFTRQALASVKQRASAPKKPTAKLQKRSRKPRRPKERGSQKQETAQIPLGLPFADS